MKHIISPMSKSADNVEELVGCDAGLDLKATRTNELVNLYAAYSEKRGSLTADQVRSYTHCGNKLYFRSFCSLLAQAYPDKKDIIEGLLGIKSHGLGFRLKKEILEEGLRQFPKGYLELGAMPVHSSVDFTVVAHGDKFPIETFPSIAFARIASYLESKGARIHNPTRIFLDQIAAVHPSVELQRLLFERSRESQTVQQIDDYDFPLDEEIFEYIKKAPSVLFEASRLKDRLVIAIPGVVSNHSTSTRGYFNAEAALLVYMAGQGKKAAIIDLDASFADGTTQICLGKNNIKLIGIQTNPFVDPTINYREYCASQENSVQFNIEPGLNGRRYIEVLRSAVQEIPKDADLLIVSFGTNLYAFDSVGLQCVEEKYFREIGEIVGRASKDIPKIIITPAGGYEEYAPQLFTEFCNGVGGVL